MTHELLHGNNGIDLFQKKKTSRSAKMKLLIKLSEEIEINANRAMGANAKCKRDNEIKDSNERYEKESRHENMSMGLENKDSIDSSIDSRLSNN